MAMKIDHDLSRFKQIVRGKIRENLRKYITHGEMIGRKGRDLVSIPLPQLDVPHFRYGKNGSGGVGQGDGEVGTARRHGRRCRRTAQGQAGSDPGAHILEVEVSLEELAAILGDELELPRIEPKGKANIEQEKARVHQHPPHRPRIAAALQAHLHGGAAPADLHRAPTIRDRPRDRADPRRQALSLLERRSSSREANAVIIYMMDVSGSMTDEQKEIVRTEAFWIDTWLRQPVRRHRDALHHPRRRGQGSRRGHVLSHPRKRRHADQLGLQGLPPT